VEFGPCSVVFDQFWRKKMRHASLKSFSEQSVIRTTDEARERLQSAISILDSVTSESELVRRGSVTEQEIRAILKARRDRAKFFPADLFADPAWDMLLELYAAQLGQRRISVSKLCLGSGVPPTTALRWINTLERKRLLTRSADALDGRRVFVQLSDEGITAMTAYFANNLNGD
jgi:DNA-binding MarR family transcriptional regulator